MGKVIGIVLIFGGIIGVLYQWMEQQKVKEKCVEEFCIFLHKSIYMMQSEKIKVIDYFAKYSTHDSRIADALQEISKRLNKNIYPNPQSVWEEVLKDQKWNLDEDIFSIIIKSGNGFFGKNRAENISFLKRQLAYLEAQQMKQKEKNAKERKVWVPVGILSGWMMVILLI